MKIATRGQQTGPGAVHRLRDVCRICPLHFPNMGHEISDTEINLGMKHMHPPGCRGRGITARLISAERPDLLFLGLKHSKRKEIRSKMEFTVTVSIIGTTTMPYCRR